MATRTSYALVLALALLAGVPTVAAGPGSQCESYEVHSVAFVNVPFDAGEVRTCDEDRDGSTDTMAFETEPVPAKGYASVTDEEKPRKFGQDDETQAQARLAPGTPMKPIIYHELTLQDDGSDGQIDRMDHKAEVHTRLFRTQYWTMTLDEDGDHLPDTIAPLVCGHPLVCVTLPSTLPQIPERVDLPDTVIEVEPIGYVP